MGDILSWAAEQDELTYSQEFGERDRLLNLKLREVFEYTLKDLEVLTISEFTKLLTFKYPHIGNERWLDSDIKFFEYVYSKVKAHVLSV